MTTQTIQIKPQDLIQEAQLSCQIPSLITGILTRKIIAEQAQSLNLTVTDEELQLAADQIRLAERLQRAEDTYDWLKTHHLSVDEFEQLAVGNVLSQKLAHHLFETQVEAYFAEHQLDYFQVSFSEVILSDMDLALELFFSIQEQEVSFWEVAQAHLQDVELRRMGGYQGFQTRLALKPEVCAVVFGAQPNQILKPILSSMGIHLIQVHEVVEPTLTDEVRNQIMSTLFLDWLNQQVTDLQRDLMVQGLGA